MARRLFQNLLGLWDLVEEGKPVRLDEGPRPPRPKKVKALGPLPFAPGEPDTEFVEAAWRYLEDDEKERTPPPARLRQPAGCDCWARLTPWGSRTKDTQ